MPAGEGGGILPEVDAPLGHADDDLLDGLVKVLGVEALGRTPLLRDVKLVGVDVNGDDAARLGLHGRLNHSEADGSETKHGHGGALVHLGGVVDGAPARGHTAAEQRHL